MAKQEQHPLFITPAMRERIEAMSSREQDINNELLSAYLPLIHLTAKPLLIAKTKMRLEGIRECMRLAGELSAAEIPAAEREQAQQIISRMTDEEIDRQAKLAVEGAEGFFEQAVDVCLTLTVDYMERSLLPHFIPDQNVLQKTAPSKKDYREWITGKLMSVFSDGEMIESRGGARARSRIDPADERSLADDYDQLFPVVQAVLVQRKKILRQDPATSPVLLASRICQSLEKHHLPELLMRVVRQSVRAETRQYRIEALIYTILRDEFQNSQGHDYSVETIRTAVASGRRRRKQAKNANS